MKKAHTQENFNENKYQQSISDSFWLDWIVANGNAILMVIFGIIAVSFLYFYFFSASSNGEMRQYIQAQQDFIALNKAAKNPEDALTQQNLLDGLNVILKKQPELRSKYEGNMAQILLDKGEVSQAIPLMNRTMERTKAPYLAFYDAYAHTTQSIANKEYTIALDQAKDLKKQMKEQASSGLSNFDKELYGFNLVRIAILSQQTGDKTQEAEAWNELNQTKNGINYLAAVQSAFVEGKFSLSDYIKVRLSELEKK